MFTRRCSACARRQLIFPSMISGIERLEQGVRISYRCWCGHDQQVETDRLDQVVPTAA